MKGRKSLSGLSTSWGQLCSPRLFLTALEFLTSTTELDQRHKGYLQRKRESLGIHRGHAFMYTPSRKELKLDINSSMWGSGTYSRCLDVYLHLIFKRFIIFKCVCSHVCHRHIYEGQRTSYGTLLSPTVCILDVEPWSLGLALSAFTAWALTGHLMYMIYMYMMYVICMYIYVHQITWQKKKEWALKLLDNRHSNGPWL